MFPSITPRHILLAVGMSTCLLGSACSASATPAPLAAGQPRTVTGNPRYDRFFGEVGGLLDEVQQSEREEREVRGAVARRLGLRGDVTVDVLGARLRERTAKLAQEGLTLELRFGGIDEAPDTAEPAPGPGTPAVAGSARPSATATLSTPGRQPEPRELRLLEVLGQAALSAATIYVEMGRIVGRTAPLSEEANKLSGYVQASFVEAAQRDRVRRSLGEAITALPLLNERARNVGNSADTLISLLDEAANTAASARRRFREPAAPRDSAPDP
jgi:hypothetical protein